MAWAIEQLEVRTRFGGRGVVASTIHDGRRLSCQSSQGHQSAVLRLVSMLVFGSVAKNYITAAESEYELKPISAEPSGERVFSVTRRLGF
jgi:hypothetical protein